MANEITATEQALQSTLLIVEDSQLQAEMLRRILTSTGLPVRVAKNGEEGLQFLSKHPCSLVISDINMPEINGYELCRIIKLDEKLWNIPVILVTTRFDPKDIIMALDAGADSYIIKPYAEDCLLNHIHSLLEKPICRKLADERRNIHLAYGGQEYAIAVGGQRMATILLSVYENALNLNKELLHAHDIINALNQNLNQMVCERTAALQESEEKYRSIFDEAGDGIVLIDYGGMIVDCNHEFERQTGRTLEQLRQTRICELLPENMADISLSEFQKIRQSGTDHANYFELKKPKGEPISIELRTIPVTIGSKHYLQSITRDITERRQTEARLAEQLRELQRWNDALVGREMRNIELKHEINVLLAQSGAPPRYPSAEQLNAE